MAAEIFDSPTKQTGQSVVTYFVGQPLIFSIRDTGAAPDRFIVKVDRYFGITGGTATTEAKLYLTPNANNRAFFDLSKIAGSRIEPGLTQKLVGIPSADEGKPIHTTGWQAPAQQRTLQRYVVSVARYNNGTEGSYTDSETIYIVAGAEQPTSGLFPDRADYMAGGKYGWLSDIPAKQVLSHSWVNERYIVEGEEQVATLLLGRDIGFPISNTFQILYLGYDKFGGTASKIRNLDTAFGNPSNERVLYFGIGWYTLRVNLILEWANTAGFDADNIRNVSFGIFDTSGTTPSTGFEGGFINVNFVDNPQCKNGFVQLAYQNSKGGWDYLRFNSRTPRRITTEGKQYRKSLNNYNGSTFTMDAQSAQYETYAKSARKQYTLSDLFFTEQQRDQLEFALRSKVVQIRRWENVGETTNIDYGWEPATILTNSLVIEPSGSRFYNVSIDVEVAQDIRC